MSIQTKELNLGGTVGQTSLKLLRPEPTPMWKRGLIIFAALLGLTGLVLIVLTGPTSSQGVPSYVPGAPADAVTNLSASANYDWGDDVPFQGDRMWVWSVTRGRTLLIHTYWVDLHDRAVLGELFNAEPVFSNKDLTKLLCSGQGLLIPTLRERLARWLTKVTGIKVSSQVNREETFWILDLRSNRARSIGSLSQYPGAGSSWHPSPGFRFGYNIPSTSKGGEFYLCDLEQETMKRMELGGEIQGWWDEHQLLVKDGRYNFVRLDVTTGQTNILFSTRQLHGFLTQSELTGTVRDLKATPVWTGSGYTFYFSARTNWVSGRSFLLKAERTQPHLNLLSEPPASGEAKPIDSAAAHLKIIRTGFDFEWLGRFNPEGTLYVFPGEAGKPGRGGDGSVHIRDLRTGSTRTVIPSDGSGQYSLPRFYQHRVIYIRSRQPWSIEVNGSNNAKLFALPSNLETPTK